MRTKFVFGQSKSGRSNIQIGVVRSTKAAGRYFLDRKLHRLQLSTFRKATEMQYSTCTCNLLKKLPSTGKVIFLKTASVEYLQLLWQCLWHNTQTEHLASLCSASDVSWQRDTAHSCCCAPAVQQSIDISCVPGPVQQTRRSGVRRPNDETDRRTDTRP